MAASGLAGKIRRVADNDEFDLGGCSREKCLELAKAAFTDPFELKNMIKITFVVGAGKLGRQKYGDGLPADFMHALDAVGFDNDDAACCELSAAGRYKFQHDTSKNLKFVHVFPRVVAPEEEEGGEEGDEEGGAAQGGQRDPADVLAECEVADFRRMVEKNVTTYATKKRLLDSLREKLARLDEAEKKLIARETPDAALQSLYDTLDVDGLKEKSKIVTVDMQAMIDAGQLTSDEKSQASEQLDAKLAALQTDLKKAEADGKEKLKAKLEEGKEKLKATKAAVSDAKPAALAPLKYAAEIQRLNKRLLGLAKLEKECNGKYTIEQLKGLGERPDMEEAMSVLKTRSRTWFESDEEFKARLKECLAQAAPAKKASGGYPAASGGSSGGWATVKKR